MDQTYVFTFQYGSIQIKGELYERSNYKNIYIPIWFYSNILSDICLSITDTFTFQYGSIQMH